MYMNRDFRSSRVIVTDVDDDGPAQQAGLRPGDEIVSVGGQSVRGNDRRWFFGLTAVPPGTTMTFELADGRVLEIRTQ